MAGGNQSVAHSALARTIVEFLQWQGAWVFRVVGGLGQRRGCPDILCGLGGRLVCIEVKTGKAVLSEVQQAERDAIVQAGGIYIEARNLNMVEDVLVAEGLCVPMLVRQGGSGQ